MSAIVVVCLCAEDTIRISAGSGEATEGFVTIVVFAILGDKDGDVVVITVVVVDDSVEERVRGLVNSSFAVMINFSLSSFVDRGEVILVGLILGDGEVNLPSTGRPVFPKPN